MTGEVFTVIELHASTSEPLDNFFSSTIGTDPQPMNAEAIGKTGGGGPHNNLMPFNVFTYTIATVGDTPPR